MNVMKNHQKYERNEKDLLTQGFFCVLDKIDRISLVLFVKKVRV